MMQPKFNEMSRDELRAYILEHRSDEAAFHAYMDRLATEPVLARGTDEELSDPAKFAALLERVQKLKRERRNQNS